MTKQHELLDIAIKKVGNRYLTTMLIAKRIRQLHNGSPPLVPHDEGEKFFSIAVREIAEGYVRLGTPVPKKSRATASPTNGVNEDVSQPQEEPVSS